MNDPRAVTVEQWLQPGGAMTGPLWRSLGARIAPAAADLPPGTRVGPYRILEVLGRGGMAVVYRAERADGEYERQVALKVVAHRVAHGDAQALLRRERQILASLTHPNIAQLLEGGTTEDGVLWLAVELVEGVRVDRYCEERKLGRRKRLHLVLQVCDALHFAHARGLVHRDIKPSNILVDDAGAVKLLDFGIASFGDDDASAPDALTLAYASPEQRAGEVVTTASDVWQMGCLIELLIAPSLRSTDLRAILAHAKREHANKRYSTIAALAADVTSLLDHRPVAARGGGWLYRCVRLMQRNRLASAIALLAIATLSGLLIAFTFSLSAQRDAAQREAQRANAATQFMVDLFRGNDPDVSRGRMPSVQDLLSRATERLSDDRVQPLLRAQLLATIGRIQLSLGEPASAQDLFKQARQTLAVLDEAHWDVAADAQEGEAEALLQLGAHAQAVAQFESSLDTARRAGANVLAEHKARMLDVLSMAYLGDGDMVLARQTQAHAVRLARDDATSDGVRLAQSLQNYGIVLRASGESDQARAAFEESWRQFDRVYGRDHPRTARAQMHYARALSQAGRADEAYPLMQEAVAQLGRIYRKSGVTYAGGLHALALLHADAGEHARAVELLHQSIAAYRAEVPEDSPTLTWVYKDLAKSYEFMKDAERALAYYRKSYDLRASMAEKDPMVVELIEGMARQFHQLGRIDEARRATERALALRAFWNAQAQIPSN
jgi:serine/threonine-protein kinase